MVKPIRIAILGIPVSSGNRGVIALGTSLVNLCYAAAKPSEVFLMIGHHNDNPVPFRVSGKFSSIQVVNCRMSPRSRPRDHLLWILLASFLYRVLPLEPVRQFLSLYTPWIAALEQARVVGDVRGGDSFSDIYGMRRFIRGFFVAWSVVLVKGTMVQFPQTFGPYRSPLARWLARYLLKRSSVVIARDKISRRIAQDLVGVHRDVWLSPDVAFSLEAIRPEGIELYPLKGSAPFVVIGLNVNGLMFNGGYTRKNMFGLKLDYRSFLSELIITLMAHHDLEFWLVPHTYAPAQNVESDPEACRQVRLRLPETVQQRVRIVTGEYDCNEIKSVIGQCNFFIGSRMHACIAALSQGVPCVGVAYSRKFKGVFDSVGMSNWVVDGRNTSKGDAIARVIELYRKRNEIRDTLKIAAEQARKQLNEVFKRLINSKDIRSC